MKSAIDLEKLAAPRANDVGDDDGEADALIDENEITTIGVSDIFAPLAPIEWCIEGLALAPGAAACLAGYGFAGKTLTAQEIAVSKASGFAP